MERAQSQIVNTSLLKLNELPHHINYLSGIENTVYGGAIDHYSKIADSRGTKDNS